VRDALLDLAHSLEGQVPSPPEFVGDESVLGVGGVARPSDRGPQPFDPLRDETNRLQADTSVGQRAAPLAGVWAGDAALRR
jgi:hypothetical protein